MRPFNAAAVLAATVPAIGCGGGWPRAVDVRAFPDSTSAPEIASVADLGADRVREWGPLPISGGAPDGVASIGEMLLVRGADFSRQPTVSVAGLPAPVEAFTDDGGLIVRVPAGAPAGVQPIELRSAGGRARATVRVRRFALIAHAGAGRVHAVALEPDGPRPFGEPIALEGAAHAGFAPDGSAGYAVAGGGTILAIDPAAKGAPRPIVRRALGIAPVLDFDVAARAPIAVALAPDRFALVDLKHPRNPARFSPEKLPGGIEQPVAAALDPTGRRLAIVGARGNRVALLDLADAANPALVRVLDVLPDATLPALCAARFDRAGNLWLAAGDSARSLAAGRQDARLVRVDLAGAEPAIETIALPPGAPLALALPQAAEVASGAAIGEAREAVALALAATESLTGGTAPASLLRVERQAAARVLAKDAALGGVAIGAAGALVLGAAVREGAFGLQWARVHPDAAGFLSLGAAPAAAPVPLRAAVAAQP